MITLKNRNLQGSIRIPASKSDSQRAMLAASLATHSVVLQGVGASDDEKNMLRCIQELGAQVRWISDSSIEILPTALPKKGVLNIGESGLATRLLSGICGGIGGEFEIVGHGSILTRTHRFIETEFPKMGVTIELKSGKLPLRIQGQFAPGKYTVDGSESSQYISGLLMALPLLQGDSELQVEKLNSIPYVKLTLQTLREFGVQIITENFSSFIIRGNQAYSCSSYGVDRDWSSASYWLVAAALGADIRLLDLNMQSAQADKEMLNALMNANCRVQRSGNELTIDGSGRTSFQFDATHCPDLFPALAVLAAFCPGISEISGVNRLANKESNRGLVLQSELGKLGCQIDLVGDVMRIHGKPRWKNAQVESHGDHRIAMCLGVLSCFAGVDVELSGESDVSKSYPGFWDDLFRLSQ